MLSFGMNKPKERDKLSIISYLQHMQNSLICPWVWFDFPFAAVLRNCDGKILPTKFLVSSEGWKSISQHKPFLCNFKISKVKVSRRKFVTKTKLHERYGNYMKAVKLKKVFFRILIWAFFTKTTQIFLIILPGLQTRGYRQELRMSKSSS